MTFGSLFAGIGGFDLGLERAGMECRWQVEIDPFCQKVLTKHWPEVPKYGDIKELTGDELDRVDLICGGFPCQDVSSAGHRRGIEETTRSGLWSEMLRVVCVVRPRIFIVENVSALLNRLGSGRFESPMHRVLGDLAASGFDAEWDCFPTGLHRGHRRDRVFIVAYPMQPALSSAGEHKTTEDTARYLYVDTTAASVFRSVAPPEFMRNIHGIPNRVDRIKALGNAVVPQVAEWIGRRIMEAEADA